VSRIKVLVAAISLDMTAEGIFTAVAQRDDMMLVESRIVSAAEVDALLETLPLSGDCAVVLVGYHTVTEQSAVKWLAQYKNLVVLQVDIIGDIVRFAARDVGLDSLLTALRELVDRSGASPHKRVSHFQLRPLPADSDAGGDAFSHIAEGRALLNATIDWVHVVLQTAVRRLTGSAADLPGLTVTASTVAESLDARPPRTAISINTDMDAADAALSQALAAADGSAEPLALAVRTLELNALEFRVMVLALGSELDPRYQRCFGLLMDDLGRRVGTLGLYAESLGEPSRVRSELASAGKLAKWRVFDGQSGGLPPSDEPLRLDPSLRGWLLGERDALDLDLRVRRATRLVAWAGASLLDRELDRDCALDLMNRLQGSAGPQWIVLANDKAAAWRALIEFGSQTLHLIPIRVDLARLAGLDLGEIEESGIRLARMARLKGFPLIVDATAVEVAGEQDDWVRTFLAAAGGGGRPAAIIANDVARFVRLLGPASYDVEDAAPLANARVAAVQAAARGAGASLTEAVARAVASQYPLQIDGFEQAMRLARTKPVPPGGDNQGERFIAACKDVAAEGGSRLAERIEPVFELDDVVLPPDRKQQLEEIVTNVRLAPEVLEGWKFGDQLPYGRGVTALFHGPSGTGKTMAALGLARKLGIQILRIDLSRVVSKYIGDTEKNIDRVFSDAEKSGAALLIDEADALLGKRSEVNDAHDRYANIEVAFLLQRMEAYEGLAILTTNLRQNLDPAFLRRLRFIVDFPRPDADAREKIWRRCLPEDSHVLDDAAFRQLGRKIELTGGHVRQITLRAAFVAAAAESKIDLTHVAHACRAEFAKLGLPPVEIILPERRKAA
jgi:AAA+ superfamily predicted ATPase